MSGHLEYAHLSKMIHSVGCSMVDNGSYNRPILSNLSFELYSFRFDVNTYSGRTLFRVQPQALATSIATLIKYDLSIEKSLEYGSFYYTTNTSEFVGRCQVCGVIISNKFDDKRHTCAHELIHIMQNKEYTVFNTYYNPIKNKKFNKYVFLDYRIFQLTYQIASLAEDKSNKSTLFNTYYKNLYELEASHFGDNKFIDTHHNNVLYNHLD